MCILYICMWLVNRECDRVSVRQAVVVPWWWRTERAAGVRKKIAKKNEKKTITKITGRRRLRTKRKRGADRRRRLQSRRACCALCVLRVATVSERPRRHRIPEWWWEYGKVRDWNRGKKRFTRRNDLQLYDSRQHDTILYLYTYYIIILCYIVIIIFYQSTTAEETWGLKTKIATRRVGGERNTMEQGCQPVENSWAVLADLSCAPCGVFATTAIISIIIAVCPCM